MKLLSQSEELILLAVRKLQDEAYGVKIRQYLSELSGQDWSIGSVYVPLDRLTKRGLLGSYYGPSTPERGGRSKRFYRVTPKGMAALGEIKRVQDVLWAGFPQQGLAWS